MLSLLLLVLLLTPLCSCESHYSVLGVRRNAKPKEIKKAYVKLAYEWHPDKTRDPKAADMMAKINRAYEILYDEDKRRHYDLVDDDSSYLESHSSFSSYSSTNSNEQQPSEEPSDEIDTKEFMEVVLPASATTPHFVYFFHDFCERCETWTELLEEMRGDLQLIGVKMVSVNVIISSKVAKYCEVYIHEVPRLVLLINKKTYLFKGKLNLDEIKDFIFRQLPSNTIQCLNDSDQIISVESRVKSNKPLVLLVSPRTTPSLNYKMVSFVYRSYLDFYFVSSSPELSESNDDILKLLNQSEGGKLLHIYSDLEKPAAVLEGDNLNRGATKNALEKNKFLTLPRVNSCMMLDALCPGEPNARWCVLLVPNGSEEAIDDFRILAIKWTSREFTMGYLNKDQDSTLKNATFINGDSSSHLCDNGRTSKQILLLHRSTSHKLEFDWYSTYCGTQDDNEKLLKQIQTSRLTESATMDNCWFGIEPVILVINATFRDLVVELIAYIRDFSVEKLKEYSSIIQEIVGKHWEMINIVFLYLLNTIGI